MSTTLFHELYTVLSFVIFVAICVWCYLPSNKKRLQNMADIPFLAEQKQPVQKSQSDSEV